MSRTLKSLALLTMACATTSAPQSSSARAVFIAPKETHFKKLTQLTFDGENAEAYWSFDGQGVSLQRRGAKDGCDRIYRMSVFPPASPVQISNGRGATTCAHFLPSGNEVVYASTHLSGDACPPKPDMSQGYVWALYDSYEIFRANTDGSNLRQLTSSKGYDAEATVCGKDGSIVFTSDRDGDLELYRMDADGTNVKRLTFEPGYDGGAFFNKDCSKLVWRASRPAPGAALDEYKALLAKGLVRPSKLELYVANADGSEARQITSLNAASFAPFFYPDRNRILFSTNYGDPRGREFDIWAINTDGTDLEQITHAPGFDGFPMFSPDGKWLMFSSNRMTAEGQTDTNLFLAEWDDKRAGTPVVGAAERIRDDAAWLADPSREGRGIGTKGLAEAGAFIEKRFQELGLEPLDGQTNLRVPFRVTTKVTAADATRLIISGRQIDRSMYVPLGWSAQTTVSGKAILVGHAMQDAELGIDDFKGHNVKGKIAIARRFVPDHEKLQTPEAQRKAGDLRRKAFNAKSAGAKALIVVDWPKTKAGTAPAEPSKEAPLPTLHPEGSGDAGLAVIVVTRSAFESLWPKLEAGQSINVELNVSLLSETAEAFNVVGRLKAKASSDAKNIVIGAHYDHLGFGGHDSLAPEKNEPHVGGDDNASGTATVLEIARHLSAKRSELTSNVIFAAFSGEEAGVLGSSAVVNMKPAWLKQTKAMLNLDMVGRMRMNSVDILGGESASEWSALISPICLKHRIVCKPNGDGYGPSDHMPFFSAGIPVLHFFTGAHSDYHKPSDTPDKLNAGAMATLALVVADVATAASQTTLTLKKVPPPAGRGDARSFNASLGTVPDYGGPPPGMKGVMLADVRSGGGAATAGMRRGDLLVKLGKHEINSVEDLMFVLQQSRPGETVNAIVIREGARLTLETTFQEGRRR